MSLAKKVGAALTVLVLAVAGFWLFQRASEGEAAEPAYPLVQVERRDIEVVAEAAGLVEPVRVVEVKSNASGEVLAVTAETGDRVERGALLAEIDPRDVQSSLDQAEADLVGGDLAVEQPRLGGRVLQRLGQQLMHLDHLDPTLFHFQHEVVVILLRFVHPEHVVEQQRIAVRRGQPLVGEIRAVHDHRAQRSDLRVRSQGGVGNRAHVSASPLVRRRAAAGRDCQPQTQSGPPPPA